MAPSWTGVWWSRRLPGREKINRAAAHGEGPGRNRPGGKSHASFDGRACCGAEGDPSRCRRTRDSGADAVRISASRMRALGLRSDCGLRIQLDRTPLLCRFGNDAIRRRSSDGCCRRVLNVCVGHYAHSSGERTFHGAPAGNLQHRVRRAASGNAGIQGRYIAHCTCRL